ILVVAVNDPGKVHAYPPRVRFEIAETDPASYVRCADFLNGNGAELVCLQHEFGIFGGKAGSHLLLLRALRMPVVTTLHTILRALRMRWVATLHTILSAPRPAQRRVIDELSTLSGRLDVMSKHGRGVIHVVYGGASDRIVVIPHGISLAPETLESK